MGKILASGGADIVPLVHKKLGCFVEANMHQFSL